MLNFKLHQKSGIFPFEYPTQGSGLWLICAILDQILSNVSETGPPVCLCDYADHSNPDVKVSVLSSESTLTLTTLAGFSLEPLV